MVANKIHKYRVYISYIYVVVYIYIINTTYGIVTFITNFFLKKNYGYYLTLYIYIRIYSKHQWQERLCQDELGGLGGVGAAEGHRGHGADAEGGRQHQQIAERRSTMASWESTGINDLNGGR